MSTDETLSQRERLAASLEPIGQQHLLAFWDRLNAEERDCLRSQIESIDPELFRELRAEFAQGEAKGGDAKSKWAALAARAEPPPAMRLDGRGVRFTPDVARTVGAELLRAGHVGMILVAGGLGTRLGFDQPKGLFEIGPLSSRSLFQVLLEKLLAVQRRYSVRIPLYVMTSPATDEVTQHYLAHHRWFGLPLEDCHIFCQGTMWAVNDKFERILLEAPNSLFLGPDGHGGMLAALARSDFLVDAQRRNVQHLFYGQIDNPLLQVCDELFLGSHVLAGSEMTTQVVHKRAPLERVGNVVSVDGKLMVIEYSDLPDEFAQQSNADGSLKLWAGNLAVHAFDVEFLTRAARRKGALPFHYSKKKVRCLDAFGDIIEPQHPNAIRFERFIFDLLPLAQNALAVEVDPREAFAPLKNSNHEQVDNPLFVTGAMTKLAQRMLREAGANVEDDTCVEINPLWASSVEEIRAKIAPGTRISRPTYFEPNGPRVFPG